jgi:Ca2+-binding EF-hand superfamily protein
MKGLQGERLRQAFKHLDNNKDGFILPDQFKRIILVFLFSLGSLIGHHTHALDGLGTCWT